MSKFSTLMVGGLLLLTWCDQYNFTEYSDQKARETIVALEATDLKRPLIFDTDLMYIHDTDTLSLNRKRWNRKIEDGERRRSDVVEILVRDTIWTVEQLGIRIKYQLYTSKVEDFLMRQVDQILKQRADIFSIEGWGREYDKNTKTVCHIYTLQEVQQLLEEIDWLAFIRSGIIIDSVQ